MQVQCQGPGCDAVFEAKRATARFHSERCKKRAQRSQGASRRERRPRRPPDAAATGSLRDAAAAELERAGQRDSAAGRAALALAARIDAAEGETGAGLASLVREFRATLAEAVRGGPAAADPVDELRARRERKLA